MRQVSLNGREVTSKKAAVVLADNSDSAALCMRFPKREAEKAPLRERLYATGGLLLHQARSILAGASPQTRAPSEATASMTFADLRFPEFQQSWKAS
jgi:hypothetical protein